jgi:proteic killer suppression protein
LAVRSVRITASAKKNLRRVSTYIVDKLETWVDAVERESLEEVRKIPGYHDEPLRGRRQGQRSIRLSRSYRAIYQICTVDGMEIASIEEVSKHEY